TRTSRDRLAPLCLGLLLFALPACAVNWNLAVDGTSESAEFGEVIIVNQSGADLEVLNATFTGSDWGENLLGAPLPAGASHRLTGPRPGAWSVRVYAPYYNQPWIESDSKAIEANTRYRLILLVE